MAWERPGIMREGSMGDDDGRGGESAAELKRALAAVRPTVRATIGLAEARVASALFGTQSPDVVVGGRYRVVDRLGSGGMGVVYAAYDPELARAVAMKLIHVPGRGRAGALAEAQALARLSHPNVVPVHDVGADGDHVFIVMEIVRGQTLRRWSDGHTRAEILRAYAQAGAGLAAAHAAGLVHRDFKPDNALMGDDGRVRVVDFGLACESAGPDGAAGAPGGVVGGTPRYMAPEQARGEAVTAAADQYSFCVSVREALASAAAPKGGLPRHLEAALARGEQRDPGARFPSFGDLLRALGHDPRQVWRRRVAGATVAAAAIGAFVVGRATIRDAQAICREDAGQLETTWPLAAARAGLARLAGLGGYGQGLAARLEAQLADFRGRWSRGYLDACRQRGIQSAALVDRRMICLHRGRAGFQSLRDAIASARAEALPGLAVAARSLPDPDTCGDVVTLARDVEPPPAAIAAQVGEARADVERGRMALAAGDFDEARKMAASAARRGRALGYAPLTAEALLLDGHTALTSASRDLAIAPLAEAARLAFAAGDPAVGVEAWARRAWAHGTGPEGAAASLAGLEVVRALADQPSAGRFARALLYNNVGSVHLALGQRQEAAASLERAVAEARRVQGRGAVELVNARSNLAMVVDDDRRRDQLLAEVVDTLVAQLGADHPQTLRRRWTRLSWMADVARVREAGPLCQGLSVQKATSVDAFECWHELGFVLLEVGEPEGAAQAMSAAAASARLRSEDEQARHADGYVHLARGEAAAAVELFRSALAQAPTGDQWWARLRRANVELGLARALLAAGDRAEARSRLRDVVAALAEMPATYPGPLVQRRLDRARAELSLAGGAGQGSSAGIRRGRSGARVAGP